MAVAALVVASAQAPCGGEVAALMAEASVHAADLDLPRAAERLRAAANRGCDEADVAALYVGGLVDAREAFRLGAPPESLEPVRQAMASLEALAGNQQGPAEIARLMLHAAAAAAQNERDELGLFLDSALRLESILHTANLPGAPVLSALEAAGDLWLQVHWYEEARRAYTDAVDRAGVSPRAVAGLARVAARLGDQAAACAGYRLLLDLWGARLKARRQGVPVDSTEPAEIAGARAYLAEPACRPDGTGR
jgi:hypothetical protein